MGWNEEWTAASEDLRLAEEEHRIADDALGRARYRMQQAQRECARLFRERVNQVNGTEG